jgi:membrane protease YdiL (CAAX protease family)
MMSVFGLFVAAPHDKLSFGDWCQLILGWVPLLFVQMVLGHPQVLKVVSHRLGSPQRAVKSMSALIILCWCASSAISSLGPVPRPTDDGANTEFNLTALCFLMALVTGVMGTAHFVGRFSPSPEWPDVLIVACTATPLDLRWFSVHGFFNGIGGAYNWWAIAISVLLIVSYGIIRKTDFFEYNLTLNLKAVGIIVAAVIIELIVVLPIGVATGFLHMPTHPPAVGTFVAGFLFNVISVSIIEELLFRAIIQAALKKFFDQERWWIATLISSVLFGLWHWPRETDVTARCLYMLLAFVCGLSYGSVYHVTGRLVSIFSAKSFCAVICDCPHSSLQNHLTVTFI